MQVPSIDKKTVWVPGVLVAIGVLAFIFSRISITDVIDLIREANRAGVAMFLVLSLFMSVFRCWRYHLLLRVSGYDPPLFPLFLIVLVRNFTSDLIPARIGTAVYMPLVTTRLGVSAAAAASSFALAFLFDILAILPLVLLALVLLGGDPLVSTSGLVILAAFVLVVCGILIAQLPRLCRLGEWILTRPYWATHRLIVWARQVLEGMESELATARAAGIYGRLFILSIFVRIGKYGALYMFLFALLEPQGFGWDHLPLPDVFMGLVVPELAASTPFSGIAGLGAYQGAWIFMFTLLGFPESLAMSSSLAHHVCTQFYGYSMGIMAAGLLMLSRFQIAQQAQGAPVVMSWPRFLLGVTVSVCILLILLVGIACVFA